MTDRAVSVTVNYALNLAIATVLISGLLFGIGNIIENQRESAVRSELRVVGQRLAANVQTADRLAAVGGADSDVRVETPLPAQVAKTPYRFEIATVGGDTVVTLRTVSPAVTVTVSFHTEIPVSATETTGGDVVVTFDGTSLEVDRP